MSQTAFVTGGSGFIGANLVEALNERGIRPRVLLRAGSSVQALEGLAYEAVVGDVLDPPAKLAQAMADTTWVFHVAAISDYWRQGRDRVYQVNVEGTRRVVAAARQAGVRRLVFTSSLATMGVPRRGELLTETSRLNYDLKLSPYAHSKQLAEAVVVEETAEGLDAVIVNPCVVLGPRDVNLIAGQFVIDVAKGRVRIAPPGGLNFVHVGDVVAGHLAAAEKGRRGERYILGAENLSYAAGLRVACAQLGQRPPRSTAPAWLFPPLSALVGALRRLPGIHLPVDAFHVRMMGEQLYADSGKAVRELALPQTPFAQTVADAIAWYRQNGLIP